MATVAPAPDWAPRVWRDKRKNIFVQFRDGNVLRFDATSDALGKALKLFPCVEDQPGYLSGKANIADHVLKKPIKLTERGKRKRMLQSLPEDRKSRLAEMIRRAGVKEEKK